MHRSILVALIVVTFIIGGCTQEDPCLYNVVSEVASPNQNYKIDLVNIACPLSIDRTEIRIIGNDVKQSGSIFSADSNHGAAKLGTGNTVNVNIKWLNNNTIELEYDPEARIFDMTNYWRGSRGNGDGDEIKIYFNPM